MGKKFVICSGQKEYADRLAEHIAERPELAFQICVCTTLEKALDIQQQKMIDILLIDCRFKSEQRNKIESKKKFILAKRKKNKIQSNEKEIFQYQPAGAIISRILEECAGEDAQGIFRSVYREGKELIAVYSPVHRIGKTEFAMTLARHLAKQKEVLYLNLEEYAAIGGDFEERQKNLADLIYYAKQESGSLGIRVSASVRKAQEIDVIAPIPVSKDLKEVQPEEWRTLLSGIMEESIYQTVIMDLSESVQGLFGLLDMCDTIYMPVIDEPAARAKIDRYTWSIRKTGMDRLQNKTIEVPMERNKERCVRQALEQSKQGGHDAGSGTVI